MKAMHVVSRKTNAPRTVRCTVLLLMLVAATGALGQSHEELENTLGPGGTNWTPPKFEEGIEAVIATAALNGAAVTPAVLVATLFGLPDPGFDCVVANETFNGLNIQGGQFTGGGLLPVGPIGIPAGVILSSGNIASVIGGPAGMWNRKGHTSTSTGGPNDPSLDLAVAPFKTFDRAALEFDITCNVDKVVGFKYVFASEEYNSWVYSRYNDTAGIYVFGGGFRPDRALVPLGGGGAGPAAVPVTIGNVNNGNPFGVGARNPNHFQNNECGVGGNPAFPCAPARETEMDGLTFNGDPALAAPLPFFAWGTRLLAAVPYHVKLVVADTSDHVYDSNLFVLGVDAGACCLSGGRCLDGIGSSDCATAGGTYHDELLCGEFSCGTVGACCTDSGCLPSTSMQTCMTTNDGIYAGDATTCGATGACCFQDFTCKVTTELCCEAQGGTYKGDGATCTAGTCTGACCDPDTQTCSSVTPGACGSSGDIFLGDMPCAPNSCAPSELHTPTLSQWGLVVLGLVLLGSGTLLLRRRAPMI